MPSEKSRYIRNHEAKPPVGVYHEEQTALFAKFHTLDSQNLIALLEKAYQAMKPPQQRDVFGDLLANLRSNIYGGDGLLKEIGAFREKSLRGDYWAPFNVNSKNFMDVPVETTEWFDRLADLFTAAMKLVEGQEYFVAVEAFAGLFEVLDLIDDGGEGIVFADELGSWMLPVRMEEVGRAYVKALAKSEDEAGFAKAVVELIIRDKSEGFTMKVYPAAIKSGSTAQMAALEEAIKKGKVKTTYK